MTQRERHIPDGGAAPGPRASSRPTATLPPPPASVWEDWYQRASPAQREALVALAGHQGVVYARQLAAPDNGAARPLLAALLGGHVQDLEPVRPPCLELIDTGLDAWQRLAVARAVHTPDVALIQGYPGTGKSRVVAEILLQAAARGERVLLLAPTAAALDRVLERLGTHEGVCPVRCLSPEESPEALPAAVRRLTLAERLRAFQEQTLPAARQTFEAALQTWETRRRVEALWPGLEHLATRRAHLAGQRDALARQRAGLPAEVEAELAAPAAPTPLQARWAEHTRAREEILARIDGRLAELRAEADKVRTEQKLREAEREQVRPLVTAKTERRWWTGAWWRATFRGNLVARAGELDARLQELRDATTRLDKETQGLTEEGARAEEQGRANRAGLIDDEVARRQAELDGQLAGLSAEGDRLAEEWRAACHEAGVGADTPATPEAIQAAREAWQRQLQEDEGSLAFARQWLHALEEAQGTLPERLAGCANVVAITTTALAGDAYFGDRAGPRFDLLVLEEADQVTESEFLAAARRAGRWVLVGAPTTTPGGDAEGPPARKPGPNHLLHATALRPGFFQRLWQHLHADPRRLSSSWTQAENSLICRLVPVSAGQAQWVQSERVVDRPEIELRIVALPRGRPQLAEVVFPASTAIHEAKEYIYRELGELPIHAPGPSLRWVEDTDRIALELAPATDPDAVPVPLEDGARELVGLRPGDGARGVSWQTFGLQFDRAAGWTRERAEQWVADHLRLRDLGRATLLTVPHRPRPALASFLSDLLFAGGYHTPGSACPHGTTAAVEFVAVPSLAERRHGDTERGWGGGGAAVATRLRSVRGGAGLEIDLADARRLEPMPGELRAVLPAQGLVNYLEAQAVVRRLEALVTDATFRATAEAWQRRGAGAAVAVVALYPAQAELIGLLMQRVPALAAAPVAVEVGVPSAFGHRECLAALVSLTRSHTHRAVSYGEGPQALAQALTRATDQVILFGDPGTLARRSQWQGALDHLDDAAAARERGLAAQLVGYIQGNGPHPRAFCLHESGGA